MSATMHYNAPPSLAHEPGPEDTYLQEPLPICQGAAGFKEFMRHRAGSTPVVPFIASRTPRQWRLSNSLPTMAAMLEDSALYVGVEIGRSEEMTAFCDTVRALQERVVALNATTPRKNDATAFELIAEGRGSRNFDVIVREEGDFTARCFNGIAFRGWWERSGGQDRQGASFTDRPIVVVGLGAAGGRIAETISDAQPSQLTVVDPGPKEELVTALEQQVPTIHRLTDISQIAEHHMPEGVIVINAAGGGAATALAPMLSRYGHRNGSFVDIRTSPGQQILDHATTHGWDAHDGVGMSIINNYALLVCIQQALQQPSPSLDEFETTAQRVSAKLPLLLAA